MAKTLKGRRYLEVDRRYGGTRGLGFGVARQFLRRGNNVTVCERTARSAEGAAESLRVEPGEGRVLGAPCDVGDHEQVRALRDAAEASFGKVDVWVNNAGFGAPRQAFWEFLKEHVGEVVHTNVVGVMDGSRVAMLVHSGMPLRRSGSADEQGRGRF